MNRRLRLAGALAALLALSSYVVESVQAAVCLPVATANAEAGPEHDGMHHGPVQEAPQDDAPDAPQCPLGMAGMGGSCVAVSLPAAEAAPAAGFETPVPPVASASTLRDLLFAAPHFRPPRA